MNGASGSHFRDLLLTVLGTTATKREARQYIQKYGRANGQKLVSLFRLSGRDGFAALDAGRGLGLARTLAHMKALGSFPVVVLDGSTQISAYLGARPRKLSEYQAQLLETAERLGALLAQCGQQAQALATPFELSAAEGLLVKRDWLDKALAHGQIPVMLPFMYDRDSNESKFHDSFKSCEALARSLQEEEQRRCTNQCAAAAAAAAAAHSDRALLRGSVVSAGASTGVTAPFAPEAAPDAAAPYVLDKLIFIDPLGGLPSQRRRHAAHVIVNLQQEFGEVSAEILGSQHLDAAAREAHLANLNAMRDILALSGPQTTGLITDARAAANVLDRNPIVYNLLTDRPLISPSLPAELERSQLRTSLVRTGFPVHVRQAAVGADGAPPAAGLDLEREDKVGNINLTKLVRLIELSFGKRLDLKHYLARLRNNVAAIIIVGDYDGAAIITWEQGATRRIAYLDKFAVNPSSQGAQGVADIMLIQMIRRLFPREMLWRSRFNNPVNKWYFERSRGHCRLQGSNWTMFWISDAAVPPIDEYEAVCRGIEPSLVAK